VDETGGEFSTQIYNDYARTSLVAHTANYSSNGAKALIADNGSGLGGTISLASYSTPTDSVYVEFYQYGIVLDVSETFTPSSLTSLGAWYEAVDETAYLTKATQPTLANGTFAADASWTKGSGWTIGSGVASFDAASAANLSQSCGMVTDNRIQITYDIPALTDGGCKAYLGAGTALTQRTTTGTFTETGNATSATLYMQGSDGGTFSIDNVVLSNLSRTTWIPTDGYYAANLTQATAAKQPWFNSDVGGLTFGGDGLESAALVLEQPYHIFIVAHPIATGANGSMIDGFASNSAKMYVNSTSTTFGIYAGTSVTMACSNNTKQIFEGVFNGASSKLAINGGAFTTGNVGAANANGLTIGINGDGSAEPFGGHIFEVIVCTEELSAENRALMNKYLTVKHLT